MGESRGTLVLFHGSRANVSHYFPYYVPLAERGWDVVLPEYRGYPPSGGERSLAAMLRDLDPVMEWVRNQPGVEPERLAVMGISLGSILALRAAAEHGPLAAVIVEDVIEPRLALREHFGAGLWARLKASLVGGLALPRSSSPRNSARRCTVPLLVLQGADDAPWIRAGAQGVADAAAGPTQHLSLPGMGHAPDTLFQLGGGYIDTLEGFLQRAIDDGVALAREPALGAGSRGASRLTAERLLASDPRGRTAVEIAALVPPDALPRGQEALLLPLLLAAGDAAQRAGDDSGAQAFWERGRSAAPADPRAYFWMQGGQYRLGFPHGAALGEIELRLRR